MNYTEFKENLEFLKVLLPETKLYYRNIGNNHQLVEFTRVINGKERIYQLSNVDNIYWLDTNNPKTPMSIKFSNIQEIEDYFYKIYNKDEIFVQKINYYFKDIASEIVSNESQSELIINGLVYGITNQFDKWVLSFNSLGLSYKEYDSLSELINENFNKNKLELIENIQKSKDTTMKEINEKKKENFKENIEDLMIKLEDNYFHRYFSNNNNNVDFNGEKIQIYDKECNEIYVIIYHYSHNTYDLIDYNGTQTFLTFNGLKGYILNSISSKRRGLKYKNKYGDIVTVYDVRPYKIEVRNPSKYEPYVTVTAETLDYIIRIIGGNKDLFDIDSIDSVENC